MYSATFKYTFPQAHANFSLYSTLSTKPTFKYAPLFLSLLFLINSLCLIVSANEVDHDVGMLDTPGNGRLVSNAVWLRSTHKHTTRILQSTKFIPPTTLHAQTRYHGNRLCPHSPGRQSVRDRPLAGDDDSRARLLDKGSLTESRFGL